MSPTSLDFMQKIVFSLELTTVSLDMAQLLFSLQEEFRQVSFERKEFASTAANNTPLGSVVFSRYLTVSDIINFAFSL